MFDAPIHPAKDELGLVVLYPPGPEFSQSGARVGGISPIGVEVRKVWDRHGHRTLHPRQTSSRGCVQDISENRKMVATSQEGAPTLPQLMEDRRHGLPFTGTPCDERIGPTE